MRRYFVRAFLGHLRGGVTLFLLSVFGVAIGVASVLSIQILNLNALGAFRGSMQAVSGDADFMLVGRTPTIEESLYPEVLGVEGVISAWPLYRVNVALADDPDFFLDVVGIDLLIPMQVPFDADPGVGDDPHDSGFEFVDVVDAGNWVAISPGLAGERGFRVGDSLPVTLGSERVELQIGALVDFQKVTPLASPRLVVMDISTAQSVFGGIGTLTQIDVRIDDEADREQVRASLEQRLSRRAQVLSPEQREEQAAELLGAFRLNLTALSLISLFVGGFLVYSSTQASLVRRRHEFGLLRSLGATRSQVLGLLLGDVLVLALVGVLIGMPLGYWAARLNVDMVSATLSSVYLLEEIHTLRVPWSFYLLALFVGIFGAALGGLFPAVELSRKDTRALLAAFTLHERVGRAAPMLFSLGCLLLVAVAGMVAITRDRWPPAGFVEAFALLVALPLVTPFVVQRVTARLKVRRLGFSYGMKGLGKQLQTTPVAIAALAIAVSMLVGITTMVSSFRETLSIWISATVQADIYVSTPSWRRARREAVLQPEIIARMRTHPAVRQLDRLRQLFVWSGDRKVSLAGVDVSVPMREGRFTLLEGDIPEAMQGLREGGVMLGEPLARKTGLGLGDSFVIESPTGERALPVVAVYYDYSSESGSAFMAMESMEKIFGPGPIHNVALYLHDGEDAELVADSLRAELAELPLVIRSNRRLRQEVFRIFDQTFAITRLLQLMGLMIAVCGITLTLLVLARERVAELALYRALGADRSQLFRVFLGKGLGMAFAGLALGGIAGCGFAFLLIYIINRAYFGWTIAVFWPLGMLARQAVVIVLAAVGASVYPALVASRTPATELRREDV